MHTRGKELPSSSQRIVAHPPSSRQISSSASSSLIQRAKTNPHSLHPNEVVQLQQTIGNRAVMQLFRSTGQSAAVSPTTSRVIQRKVTFDFPLKSTVEDVTKWLGKWQGWGMKNGPLLETFLRTADKTYSKDSQAEFRKDFSTFASTNRQKVGEEAEVGEKAKASSGDWKTSDVKRQLHDFQREFAMALNSLHHKAAKSHLEALFNLMTTAKQLQLAHNVLGMGDLNINTVVTQKGSVLRNLKSLASNLTLGPAPDRRTFDPGQGADFNTKKSGKLTPRSDKYEKVLEIHNKATKSGSQQLSAKQSDRLISLLSEAQQLHKDIVGDEKMLDPSSPFSYDVKTGKWDRIPTDDKRVVEATGNVAETPTAGSWITTAIIVFVVVLVMYQMFS